MRKTAAAVMIALTAMPSVAQVAGPIMTPAISTSAAEIVVPADTVIWLAPLRDISSKHVRTGDAITMQVSRDVFVRRILVIPRGTEATGKISYRTGKGALGKSAKIEFDLVSLGVGHRAVPIAAHYRVAGDGNSAWAVATFLLVSVVGSLFITGHSAVIPAGSEWRATTAAPLVLTLDDDGLPLPVAASLRRTVPGTAAAAPAAEHDIPPASAYVPAPPEIFVKSLPPRP